MNRKFDEFDAFEAETTSTIAEAFDVLVESTGRIKRVADYLTRVSRPFFFSVGVIAVVVVLLVYAYAKRDERLEKLERTISELNATVQTLEDSAEKSKQASTKAQIASEAANRSLQEALAQSQRGGVNPEVLAALNRINDIYAACVARGECK